MPQDLMGPPPQQAEIKAEIQQNFARYVIREYRIFAFKYIFYYVFVVKVVVIRLLVWTAFDDTQEG